MTVGDALAMPAGGGDEDEDEFDNSFGTWFRSFPGRSIYLHVPQAFFEDDFNLCEAQSLPNFDLLWDTILAEGCPDDTVLDDEGLCEDFFRFYQVMHQRFILTRAGLQQMFELYNGAAFGRCPRTLCMGAPVLPLGRSALPGVDRLLLYCPRCQDAYTPPSRRMSQLDGCGFGPTFPHLLILQFKDRLPSWSSIAQERFSHTPRIFGFKISSLNGGEQARRCIHQPADDYY